MHRPGPSPSRNAPAAAQPLAEMADCRLPDSRSLDLDARIAACRARIATLEDDLWAHDAAPAELDRYQAAFRELERLLALRGNDARHRFMVVIPVADRPRHLRACLESLLQLCRLFAYGGFSQGRYRKVAVMIADDSQDPASIAEHRSIAREFTGLGIETTHFGLEAQLALLHALPSGERGALTAMTGDGNAGAFHHKGPSAMRNIALLKLATLAYDEATLFHFIDSDQEFRVKLRTARGDREVYGLNFFHHLDEVFSRTDAAILTGKVVGDPPVSPAVMAGNFLDDVLAFLAEIGRSTADAACAFHVAAPPDGDRAAYHDMANLFGFGAASPSHRYLCDLDGEHDHGRCLGHFASQLGRFFHGEHPTRKTCFHPGDILAGVQPARTVYTGNYAFTAEGLAHFIPFASLRLRMAGPVLGRLIKAQLGARFVAANVPMLHRRTVGSSGASEFRPGVSADAGAWDLAGEFERQFFGDVMLFSIEALIATGFPGRQPAAEAIATTVAATHQRILAQYLEKRGLIRDKLDRLRALVADPARWWNSTPGHAATCARFEAFIAGIEYNFGDAAPGYGLVASPDHVARRHAEIVAAIDHYAQDRKAWAAALASLRGEPRVGTLPPG